MAELGEVSYNLGQFNEKLRQPLPKFQWWEKWRVLGLEPFHHWFGGGVILFLVLFWARLQVPRLFCLCHLLFNNALQSRRELLCYFPVILLENDIELQCKTRARNTIQNFLDCGMWKGERFDKDYEENLAAQISVSGRKGRKDDRKRMKGNFQDDSGCFPDPR